MENLGLPEFSGAHCALSWHLAYFLNTPLDSGRPLLK